MTRVHGVVKIHLKDKWTWIYIPWMILLSSFSINFLIAALAAPEAGVKTGGVLSIFIYMMVTGIITMYNTFPFALGMSVRRTDYFKGTFLAALLINALTTVVLLALFLIEEKVIPEWGVSLQFFSLAFLRSFNLLELFGIFFLLLLNMFYAGFAISCLQRRFGRTGMFVFFGGLLAAGSIASYFLTANNGWMTLFGWLAEHYDLLFWWSLPLTLLYMVLSYLMMRRTTV
ncbi:hypothetical protein [Paenibacillus lemnae]|uniref:Uncharacterized protein n=1 Tax=Paenibacillus lemnae TaxID=1330551 RepID=A0A848M6S3_PAELE|nr:hypothetical protein [Paenibacillus lemnae]NMO96336.1 hypothetical protein [Paenibacillus lemnae]